MTDQASATHSRGALEGVTVIDLSRVLAGPLCAQTLADHGADVIKIEAPAGDETRRWGPPFVGGMSAYYMGLNRNKTGMLLDFSEESARTTLAGLLAGADVLVENFKKGTLERWGFTRQRMETEFPQLIHCRISGFDDEGPMGGMPGYDAVLQAISGLMSVNGEKGGAPLRVGVPIVDMVTGLNSVIGILLALQERAKSGRGQMVKVSLFDTGLSLLHPHSHNFLASGDLPERLGSAHPNVAPYDTFETKTGPIFLAVGSNGQFEKLCECLDRPELARDPRFATNPDRNKNREALTKELQPLLAAQDVNFLAETLMRQGVPCGPVLDVGQTLTHPQARYHGRVWQDGQYRGIAPPVKLARTPASYRKPPPEL